MANDPKLIGVHGVQLLLESSYAGGGSPGATDAILIDEEAEAVVQYVHSGERTGSPGSGAPRRRLVPSGGFVDGLSLMIAGRGAGVAYDSSPLVVPFDTYVAMRICGYDAAIDITGGAEKVTFTPSGGPPMGGTFASAVGLFYAAMESVKLKGLIGDLKVSMKDAGPLMFNPVLKGILDTLNADAVVPTMTYGDATLDPPKCVSIGHTITPSGGSAFTPKLRSWDFAGNRKSGAARNNRNAAGHSGFAQGVDRDPTINMTIERVDAATFNPPALFAAATVCDLVYTVPGSNYNKIKFRAQRCQLAEPPKPGRDDPLALWDLVWKPHGSTLALNDDHSFEFGI